MGHYDNLAARVPRINLCGSAWLVLSRTKHGLSCGIRRVRNLSDG
jgi:hypothetical protein